MRRGAVLWLLALAVALAVAQLPTPLTSYASSSLYGADCSEMCFNGTQMLQPETLGYTNDFCTDERACYWRWHLRLVPCSASLLAFDAEIGDGLVRYSDVDPTTHATLGFYCMQSGDGVALQLRPGGSSTQFLMEWRYEQTNCADALAALAGLDAPFAGSTTLVQLGVGHWRGSAAVPLPSNAQNCDAPQQRAEVARPCQQCFAGTQLAPLERNASAELTQACGFMAGDAAIGAVKDCAVRWHFCWDACTGRTTDLAVALGSGAPLRTVSAMAGRDTRLRAGEPDDRGRTLFALTDATSVQELDDGGATFYLAWEYREAPPTALWRADARDPLFVALHFALLTDASELLIAVHQTGAAHALGAYAWDGSAPTGMDAVVEAARSLSHTEAGLVAGIVVLGVLFLASVACNVWQCVLIARSQHDVNNTHVLTSSVYPSGGGSSGQASPRYTPLASDAEPAATAAPAATAPISAALTGAAATDPAAQAAHAQQLTDSVSRAEARLAAALQAKKSDMTLLWTDSAEGAAHEAALDREVRLAQAHLEGARLQAGSRFERAARSIPGAATLAAGRASYQQRALQ